MAVKPTDLAIWGTDETNDTEPSAGQKASGWVTDQVAVSAYMNWWMRTIHEWIQYVAESTLVEMHAPSEGVTDNANQPGSIWNSASTDILYMPIRGKIGDELTEVLAYFAETLSDTMTLKVFKKDASTNGAPAQLGSTQTTPGSGAGNVTLSVTGLTETFADGFTYWAEIQGTATGGVDFLGMKTTRTRKVLG